MSSSLDKPLKGSELDELERFLLSDRVSDETLTLSPLDGFLTALVIGPTTVMPSRWLPRVWGESADAAPEFASERQANRILGFLMRHMNGIVSEFETAPDEFEPLFDIFLYEGHEYLCGEGWAMGFMMGVDLVRADWKPLFDDPAMRDVFRPLHLLGSEELSPEYEVLCETPLQREGLTKQIVRSLVDIHAFWLPYRERAYADLQGTTVRRDQPKVGANEPCPCGSGVKFKKCCGAVVTRH